MPLAAEMSPRMQAILDAAIRVLARKGLRGLTHRAVDAEAGLPEGSTSGYLRTRLALLLAVAQRLSARLTASITELAEALGSGVPDDEVVDQAIELFVSWLDQPDELMAKAELWLEAVRQPEIAEVFRPFREVVVGLVAQMLDKADTPVSRQRAAAVIAAVEGVLSSALSAPVLEREAYVRATSRTIIDAFRS